jgi:hypothetical protein
MAEIRPCLLPKHKLLVITKISDGPGEEIPEKYNTATIKKDEFNTILLQKKI